MEGMSASRPSWTRRLPLPTRADHVCALPFDLILSRSASDHPVRPATIEFARPVLHVPALARDEGASQISYQRCPTRLTLTRFCTPILFAVHPLCQCPSSRHQARERPRQRRLRGMSCFCVDSVTSSHADARLSLFPRRHRSSRSATLVSLEGSILMVSEAISVRR